VPDATITKAKRAAMKATVFIFAQAVSPNWSFATKLKEKEDNKLYYHLKIQ